MQAKLDNTAGRYHATLVRSNIREGIAAHNELFRSSTVSCSLA